MKYLACGQICFETDMILTLCNGGMGRAVIIQSMSSRKNMLQFTLGDSDEDSPKHSGVIPIEGHRLKDHFQAVSVRPSMFAARDEEDYEYANFPVKGQGGGAREEERVHIKMVREMEHDESLRIDEPAIEGGEEQLDSKIEEFPKQLRTQDHPNEPVEDEVTPPLFSHRGNLEIVLSDSSSESETKKGEEGELPQNEQIQSGNDDQNQSQIPQPKTTVQKIDPNAILKDVANIAVFLHNMATTPVPSGQFMHLVIVRNSSGLNNFWPEFQVYFHEGEHKLLYAKKMMGSTTSNYYITSQSGIESISHPTFIAKMRGNFSGSIYHVFDNGVNPEKANSLSKARAIHATIKFKSQILTMEPRSFEVFMLQKGVSYQELDGFIPLKEIGLDELYLRPANREKLLHFMNKKPVFSQAFKGYILNFGGRVQKPSIKNFILEESGRREVLMLGKSNDDLYRLDVSSPIPPYIALCICLANFDSKFLSD